MENKIPIKKIPIKGRINTPPIRNGPNMPIINRYSTQPVMYKPNNLNKASQKEPTKFNISNLDWNLRDAGNAILIATGFICLQILLMLFLNLGKTSSLILGISLFLIFALIIYLMVEPARGSQEITKKI